MYTKYKTRPSCHVYLKEIKVLILKFVTCLFNFRFLCSGDLFDEEEMLDWLTDPTVMEISDQIEKVNKKMFEKLISRNEFLTVFFCKLSFINKLCLSVYPFIFNKHGLNPIGPNLFMATYNLTWYAGVYEVYIFSKLFFSYPSLGENR